MLRTGEDEPMPRREPVWPSFGLRRGFQRAVEVERAQERGSHSPRSERATSRASLSNLPDALVRQEAQYEK
jgi:hypothetical protein